MNKLKAFGYVFIKSISSIDYYKDLLKVKTSFSVKYFVILALILTIISTVATSIKVMPETSKFFSTLSDSIKQVYPADLTFEAKNNSWTVNRPEPFIIPMPIDKDELNEGLQEDQKIENLVVFDHKGTVEDFSKLETLVLVNEKNVLVKDKNGFRAYPLENIPDGTMDKAKFDENVTKLNPLFDAMPKIVSAMVGLGYVLKYFLLGFIYIINISIVLWILGRFAKLKPTFGECNRIIIHTATLSYVIETVVGLASIEIPFAMWFSLLNLVFATIVINKITREEVVVNKGEPITPEVLK